MERAIPVTARARRNAPYAAASLGRCCTGRPSAATASAARYAAYPAVNPVASPRRNLRMCMVLRCMKVLRNARVYRYDPAARTYSRHDGLVLDGSRIVSLEPGQAGAGIESLDCGGATVLPAFADCHVHLTDTGYFLGDRFLGGVRSYDEFADAVARIPDGEFVFAGQYDESTWRDGGTADAAPLERNFPEARAMLVRVDGHSCVVNRKTF